MKAAKENGIHTAVETSGHAQADAFCEALAYTDLLLYDCKLSNEEDHIRYTGVGRSVILENLRTASERGVPVILRCPIIPAVNDTEKHMAGIAETAKKVHSLREIHLEPYHSMGINKHIQLGKAPLFRASSPKDDDIQRLKACLSGLVGVPVKVSK